MAMTPAQLQKKRTKHNVSRKGRKYNPKKYYSIRNGPAPEQAEPVYNPVKDSLVL